MIIACDRVAAGTELVAIADVVVVTMASLLVLGVEDDVYLLGFLAAGTPYEKIHVSAAAIVSNALTFVQRLCHALESSIKMLTGRCVVFAYSVSEYYLPVKPPRHYPPLKGRAAVSCTSCNKQATLSWTILTMDPC